MAGGHEASQEINQYGSLEDFNREWTITSSPIENLIDLSSVIGESSTTRPSAPHQTVLNNASPNWQSFRTQTLSGASPGLLQQSGPAQYEPRERPSLLDTSEVTFNGIRYERLQSHQQNCRRSNNKREL